MQLRAPIVSTNRSLAVVGYPRRLDVMTFRQRPNDTIDTGLSPNVPTKFSVDQVFLHLHVPVCQISDLHPTVTGDGSLSGWPIMGIEGQKSPDVYSVGYKCTGIEIKIYCEINIKAKWNATIV